MYVKPKNLQLARYILWSQTSRLLALIYPRDRQDEPLSQPLGPVRKTAARSLSGDHASLYTWHSSTGAASRFWPWAYITPPLDIAIMGGTGSSVARPECYPTAYLVADPGSGLSLLEDYAPTRIPKLVLRFVGRIDNSATAEVGWINVAKHVPKKK